VVLLTENHADGPTQWWAPVGYLKPHHIAGRLLTGADLARHAKEGNWTISVAAGVAGSTVLTLWALVGWQGDPFWP
jgi:hypothetical protein